MRNLFVIALLLVAVAASAQEKPALSGDEVFIGIDQANLTGLFSGIMDVRARETIFYLWIPTKHKQKKVISHFLFRCVARGEDAEAILNISIGDILSVSGHHDLRQVRGGTYLVIVIDQLVMHKQAIN